jgi:hypothetical protein
MASDDKKTKADPVQKTKADPASKSDAPKKDKSTADTKSTGDAKGTADATSSADAAPAKAEGGEKEAGSPSGYHRGEGQKPVTQAYKDNWNAIFGNDKKKKKR